MSKKKPQSTVIKEEANPNHKEDFMALLSLAAQPKPTNKKKINQPLYLKS